MNLQCIFILVAIVGMFGCARMQRHVAEPADPGETKVKSETPESAKTKQSGWRETFNVNKADLAPTGTNPYLPIQPGKVLKLAHGNDRLTVSILPDTKTVDGVTTGVLEEREEKDGELIEVSRNFLATDRNTGDVYYFGEDVDNYTDGKIINHDERVAGGRARRPIRADDSGQAEGGQPVLPGNRAQGGLGSGGSRVG
jgi:hypothetical protein